MFGSFGAWLFGIGVGALALGASPAAKASGLRIQRMVWFEVKGMLES